MHRPGISQWAVRDVKIFQASIKTPEHVMTRDMMATLSYT